MLGKYWLEGSCIWAVLRWGARWWRGGRGEAWWVCLGSIRWLAILVGIEVAWHYATIQDGAAWLHGGAG